MAECVDSQKTKDILTCSICQERFIKPKSLPCLHTFCEGCILTYSTSIQEKLEGKNYIECPVCRATVQLPKKECTAKEFVDQLPSNSLIIGLLEKKKVTRPEKICMSCERLDITSNATFICMDCSDTLCDTCLKYHKSNKATANHDIQPISTLTDDVNIPKAFKNMCALHSKKLKLFCNDHDIPCCTLCVSLCHRKCDNVIAIEEKAKRFCTDAKFEKLKMDIRHILNDFDTLLSHYTECLRSNEKHYEDKQKMVEVSCSNMISKVRAMEITKKAELKKIYEEKKHILENRMDNCTNCKKAVLSDKQTIEVSIEKASEVQVMIGAQKIANQAEKYKQQLRTYKFDSSKILISLGTDIQNLFDWLMNTSFNIFVRNEYNTLKLLTDEHIFVFNSVQKSSLNQSVGYFCNPKGDIKISDFKFENTRSDQKSSAVSFQSGAKPQSAEDIKFSKTKVADSTTLTTGRGFKFGSQTVPTVKLSSDEGDTVEPSLCGEFTYGQLPESNKDKATQGTVSFRQTASSTSGNKMKL